MNGLSYTVQNALYRIKEIQKIESEAQLEMAPHSLIRAAGKDTTEYIRTIVQNSHDKIIVLVGQGIKACQALDTALQLTHAGFTVKIILCSDSKTLPAEEQQYLQRALDNKIKLVGINYLLKYQHPPYSLVIDGLFAPEVNQANYSSFSHIIKYLNHLSQLHEFPVLALDIPSGLHPDTGQLLGDIAVCASHTLSYIGNKPGLYTGSGRDYAGQVVVTNLDIPNRFFPHPFCFLNHPLMFHSHLRARQHNSNKGNYGDVYIIGGADGMQGAALLAGRSALFSGAGRVFIGFITETKKISENPQVIFDVNHPELMCRLAKNCTYQTGTVVIGPGLGHSQQAQAELRRAILNAQTVVIDADGLNLIATTPKLQRLLIDRNLRNAPTLLTPHPLEAARLLNVSVQQIQADRLKSAQSIANKFKAVVILKGSGSIIACSDTNTLIINPTGNPALATAGTGDVLSGLCGALLAQQIIPHMSAQIAVWIHGKAADELVRLGTGPIGLTAHELIPMIRSCINNVIKDKPDALLIDYLFGS